MKSKRKYTRSFKVKGKFYKNYCSKMRLTKKQLVLVKTIANNDGIKLSSLLTSGFNQTMIDCLVSKGALWIGYKDNVVSLSELRLKGFKLSDPSFKGLRVS
jgi:hypothetical protein